TDHQPGILEVLTVGVVDLIAMAMPLLDMGLAVALGDNRAWQQFPRVRARPHGSASVAIPGRGAAGANSLLSAPSRPAMLRATSITMHCRPRQSPKIGIWFSRAYRMAPTLPSTPRIPNPPGMTTPSTSLSTLAAPSRVWQSSDGTQRITTLAWFANPPARSASQTEREGA